MAERIKKVMREKDKEKANKQPGTPSHKGSFPIVLEKEVELFNKKKKAEAKESFEKNIEIQSQSDQVLLRHETQFKDKFPYARVTEVPEEEDDLSLLDK